MAEGPGIVRTITTWIGAAVAFVVLLGLGTWFYQLGVRDAQSVPVIRASTEPVKVRPENAGGEVTPHQDIASYDAGSANRAPEPRPQLAEPAPEPAEEDIPVVEPEPAPEPEVSVATVAPDVQEPVAPEPEAEPVVEETPPPAPVESSRLAPAFSPSSPRRPSDLAARLDRAARNAEQDQDRLADQARSSRIKIQLRASPNRNEIVSAWRRIQDQNRDVLGSKALALQTTTSGGTEFFRLRVGPFRNRAEANSVCEALRARGQDCIVTTSG